MLPVERFCEPVKGLAVTRIQSAYVVTAHTSPRSLREAPLPKERGFLREFGTKFESSNESTAMASHIPEEDAPRGELNTHYRSKDITQISRTLRKRSTGSEGLLWKALRGRNLAGLKFRRQHPFGSSIVDFYCHEKRLVVEIDGAVHQGEDAQDRDKIRQEIIELYGVRFLRLTADEVESDLRGSLVKIKAAAKEIPHPRPVAGPSP